MSVFEKWITSEDTVGSIDEGIDRAKAIVAITEYSGVVEKLSDVFFFKIPQLRSYESTKR